MTVVVTKLHIVCVFSVNYIPTLDIKGLWVQSVHSPSVCGGRETPDPHVDVRCEGLCSCSIHMFTSLPSLVILTSFELNCISIKSSVIVACTLYTVYSKYYMCVIDIRVSEAKIIIAYNLNTNYKV